MAQVQLKGKLLIGAVLTVKTGLHIGDSSDFAPIGAVDSPFIRDPLTKAPIIPGSSLKGKMRTLLARVRDDMIELHLPKPEEDEAVVARLFGISSKTETKPARLQFRDAFVKAESRNKFKNLDTDTYLGEIKAENTINRGTGVANPRMIERVPAGMEFDFRRREPDGRGYGSAMQRIPPVAVRLSWGTWIPWLWQDCIFLVLCAENESADSRNGRAGCIGAGV